MTKKSMTSIINKCQSEYWKILILPDDIDIYILKLVVKAIKNKKRIQ
jgi:hypothetical protein